MLDARAIDIRRSDDAVSFRGGLFRSVTNWNVLVPVDSGRIEVVAGPSMRVRYYFSCSKLLVTTTLGAVLLVVLSSVQAGRVRLFAPLLVTMGLFGGNYVIASHRLPRFVRRAVGAAE
ncbi:MAG: hypothetical protein HYR85_03690 [Planctomycetes bacterium]|nr:hypothetical protein [Planctomycetota bacterium]MBI3847174.1 hypothetical protein [Planctomycetota bacterium]